MMKTFKSDLDLRALGLPGSAEEHLTGLRPRNATFSYDYQITG